MVNLEDYESEFIPKHRKKSKKKSKKSDHKHLYEPCLVHWLIQDSSHIMKGERCSVCGKIGDVDFFETEPVEGKPRLCKLLGGKEILEKYPDLDIYDYETGEQIEK